MTDNEKDTGLPEERPQPASAQNDTAPEPAADMNTSAAEEVPAPGKAPKTETAPEPEKTPEPAETPEPTATPTPAAASPLSRRAVLGVFAGLVALALILGAFALKLRGGTHSAHRRR